VLTERARVQVWNAYTAPGGQTYSYQARVIWPGSGAYWTEAEMDDVIPEAKKETA